MKKIQLGDMFEISTPKGYAYLHYVYEDKTIGSLVRVLQGLHSETPSNFDKLDGTELNSSLDVHLYETTYRGLDPQLGRFLQIDPLASISPESAPYAYVSNNPTNFNDPSGLIEEDPEDPDKPVVTPGSNLAPVYVTAKIKRLDSQNGQVLPARSWIWDLLGGPRTWRASEHSLSIYSIDHKGYITKRPVINRLEFNASVDKNPIKVVKAAVNLKNFVKSRYLIYRATKTIKAKELLYIGKAKEALRNRYTAAELHDMGVEVIEQLDNIPNNAIALGVGQLLIDLNGGIHSVAGTTANINNATIKQIYVVEAMNWLNKNIPDWEVVFKFQ